MAEVVWTEPAVADLDAIADYIALDKPDAACALVARAFAHVEQLSSQPESGSCPRELGPRSRYRQIVEPPCRVFYRYEAGPERVFILYVMRGERLLRPCRLAGREHGTPHSLTQRPPDHDVACPSESVKISSKNAS